MSRPKRIKKDRSVVKAFVEYLASTKWPGLKIDSYPEDKADREIEAIAGSFAIEHTSMDAISDQRLHSDWFNRALGDLNRELRLPFRLLIIVPYDAIKKGQDWVAIRLSLLEWLSNFAPGYNNGRHHIKDVRGVPFDFYMWKKDSSHPFIKAGRITSSDNGFYERLRMQLNKKVKKLAKYQKTHTTC